MLVVVSPLPPRETMRDEMSGVARADNAPPPNNPQLRGFIPIPGIDTMIKLGGFAKVNGIYDFSPAGDPALMEPASIPIRGRGRNAHLDANATQFSLEARRPTSLGTLRFYLENDFYGGGGTMDFHLRQAHGQIGNFYAGYGYSAFIDTDAYPDTLDDEGPAGAAFLRVTSVRHIFKIGTGLTATLSIENPSSQIALPADATATQPMPDIVGALRIERNWGHLQGSGVVRRVGYRFADNADSSLGYGLSLSGLANVGKDFVMASFTYGKGIARYMNDLGGRDYDGVIEPDGRVATPTVYGGFVGYTHQWSDRWRSNLVGSMLVMERDRYLRQSDYRSSTYGAANLILKATSSFSAGIEGLYGRHKLQNNESADAVRLQMSFKYDFIR